MKTRKPTPSKTQTPYSRSTSTIKQKKDVGPREKRKEDTLERQSSSHSVQRNPKMITPSIVLSARSTIQSALANPQQSTLLKILPLQPAEDVLVPPDIRIKKEVCLKAGLPFFFARTAKEDGSFAFGEAHEVSLDLANEQRRIISFQKSDIEKHRSSWRKKADSVTFFVAEAQGTTKSLGTFSDFKRCGFDSSAMSTLTTLTHMGGELPYSKEDTYLIEAALLHSVLIKAGVGIIDQSSVTKVLSQIKSEHIEAVKAELLKTVAIWKNTSILHEMLRQGYDPSQISPLSLTNPMYMATLHGNKKSRDLLLQYGAANESFAPEEPLEENLRLDVI